MDEVARRTLRDSNGALEKQIDTLLVDGKYARRIPILDEIQFSSGAVIDTIKLSTTISQNYMF